MQTLEATKLNLEMTLQECSDTKQMLQKDFEKLQSDQAYTKKKLITELRNAKADIDLLLDHCKQRMQRGYQQQ